MKDRLDHLYMHDIAECCRKINKYLDGVSEEAFKESEIIQDAVVRNIEIIGEAAKSVGSALREGNPDVEWKEIMRMRDKIVHHYFKLDLDVIWQTVTEDIPPLRHKVCLLYTSPSPRDRG
jgi:uncharacterized protein with HEPN domain